MLYTKEFFNNNCRPGPKLIIQVYINLLSGSISLAATSKSIKLEICNFYIVVEIIPF